MKMKENCVPAHPPASYPVQRPRSATPTPSLTYVAAVYSVRSVALVFNRRSLNMAILIEPAAAVDVPLPSLPLRPSGSSKSELIYAA